MLRNKSRVKRTDEMSAYRPLNPRSSRVFLLPLQSRMPGQLHTDAEISAAAEAYLDEVFAQYDEEFEPPLIIWVHAPTTTAERIALELVREETRQNCLPGFRAPIMARGELTGPAK